MTEATFVYGVELRSPPPTTATSQLTQYERFLKTKSMTEQLLMSHHFSYGQTQLPPNMTVLSSLFSNTDLYTTTVTPFLSHSSTAANLSSSLSHWPGEATAVTVDGTVGNTTSNAGSNSSATAAGSRGGGDWTFQNTVIILLYAVIFLLSVVGNSLVILTLAQNKRMRTVTNVYLLNLAISDLLLGVFCMPFTLVGQVLRKFIFGRIMCKVIPYFQAVSVSVAVWTLVAISLERFFAICRPLSSRRWQTQFHAYKMNALVWLLSFLVNSPLCYVQRLQPVHRLRSTATNLTITLAETMASSIEQPMKCREMWPDQSYERAYVIFLDTGLLCFPLLTMGFAYSMIVSKLWRGLRREIQHSNQSQKHQLQITNATTFSLNSFPSGTGTKSTILPTQTQETSCYLLPTGANPPTSSTQPNSSSKRFSSCSSNNNNYCYANYPANGLHQRGKHAGSLDLSGCAAIDKRSRTRFRILKNFMGCRHQKCPHNPIIALNSTAIITPTPLSDSAGSSSNNAGVANKLYTLTQSPSSTAKITASSSETVFPDIGNSSGVGAIASLSKPKPSFKMGSNTADNKLTLSTSTTVGAALISADPPVLPIASSFPHHAIRSNYMDKSIEAKKKVIRMLFVIILEFFVCWAPLHILNTNVSPPVLLLPLQASRYPVGRGIQVRWIEGKCRQYVRSRHRSQQFRHFRK
ncbi:uncharacterized protein LOC134207625 isoform X2 [Armigeres subalbatus]|uniref:uncharacterized protein LOC134207625 isoform X2 n=1 Tax=Armigeres subalbatus TaxID=124917 RepID=UPI002ED343C6